MVVVAIVGTLLTLLVLLAHGVQPVAIFGWLLVLPGLLAMGVALAMFLMAFVARLLR